MGVSTNSTGLAQPTEWNAERAQNLVRAKWGGLIGTALEQYDFVVYGTASALVFSKVFFPQISPAVGVIAAFGAYAVGFFARPLGGLVFSRFGDRLGRKWVLVTTLFLMGISTFLIGCLPTYGQIGLAAPLLLLLLRCLQGFGAGAEYAGGTVFLTEVANPNRRGVTASLVWVGASGGTALGALAWLLVLQLPTEAVISYGWRFVFLSSVVVTVGAYVMRLKLHESLVFEAVQHTPGALAKRASPISDVWQNGRRNVWRVFFMVAGVSVQSYTYQVFMGSYLVNHVGSGNGPVFARALLVGAVAGMAGALIGGWLSDRFGRRPACLFYSALLILAPFPSFMLLSTGNPLYITLVVVFGFLTAAEGMVSAQAAYLPELFGSRYRYAGVTLGRELASIFGGFGPLLFSAVITWAAGNYVPIAILMMLVMAVNFVATLMSPETVDRDLYTELDPA